MEIGTYAGGPFAENSYLVRVDSGKGAVVIDPGAGADEIAGVIETEELDVLAVLLTHAHLDHVDGAARIREVTDAPIHLHPDDRPLYDAAPDQARAFGLPSPELPEPGEELAHGQALTFGDVSYEVRHAPGHSPGHVILWDEAGGVAFVGDVVFQGSIGRTDLPGGDYQKLMHSIRNEVLTLPDETRLFTGHGPDTTVGHERVGNPFLRPHYGGELA